MQHCNRDARAFFCRPPFTTPNVSLDLLSLALLLLICSAPCTARSRFKRPCRGRTGQHQSPHSQASPCRCASDPPLRFLTVRFTTAPCVHVTPLVPLCPWPSPSHFFFSSLFCFLPPSKCAVVSPSHCTHTPSIVSAPATTTGLQPLCLRVDEASIFHKLTSSNV
jgi:hypothetical protein